VAPTANRKTSRLVWEPNLIHPPEEIAKKLYHEAAIRPFTDGENIDAFSRILAS
jgi:hypothetical protein